MTNYITKSELTKTLAEKFQISSKETSKALDVIINIMIEPLAKNERIEIRGFSSFEVRSKEAMQVRNPKTGKTVQASKLYRTHFKAGDPLLITALMAPPVTALMAPPEI